MQNMQMLCVWAESRFLGAFAKLLKATVSFIMSVCPHVITRLPREGFSLNFMYVYFSKTFEKVQVSLKCDKNKG